MAYSIKEFPPDTDLQTLPILQKLPAAHAALGEFKGKVTSLPNPDILLDTLFLQEALASSAIENIVTTQDEAFRAGIFKETGSVEAKEVERYRDTMSRGYDAWKENRFISENMLIAMFHQLKNRHNEDYRKLPGAVLRNLQTGKTVYTPPQDAAEIVQLMRNLVNYINAAAPHTLDPLIRMALIHHQFESIHPFSDGNGRIGRILNVLYLTQAGLLDTPILYLSRAINRNKRDYYRLLQAVREDNAWEEWVIYMLEAVTETAVSALQLVSDIRRLITDYKKDMRDKLPRLYSQDLLNALFRHPYTRIDYIARELKVTRLTAQKYLKKLAEHNLITEIKSGRNNYYINTQLVALFLQGADKESGN